jgi:uncharacterized protein (TIGR03435 family)
MISTKPILLIPITLALLLAGRADAQKRFEVASVKPTDPNYRIMDFAISPGGRLTVSNWDLQLLIEKAYGVQAYQISGGPPWLESDRFSINARAEGEPSEHEVLEMLRSLLEDRFKLTVHRETRVGRVYELLPAKDGPKLDKPLGPGESFIRTMFSGPPDRRTSSKTMVGHNVSMPALAEALTDATGRFVIDKTGYTQPFDFQLTFALDDGTTDIAPALLPAIKEQLRLRLEANRGPIQLLVVDRVERPSAN